MDDINEIETALDVVRAALVPGAELTDEAQQAAWTLAKHFLSMIDQERASW